MWWLIGGLVVAAVLIPGFEAKINAEITAFTRAIIGTPIEVAGNQYMKLAAFAIAAGFGVWLLESHIAEKKGQEVLAPPVESIHVAAPPTFGASGGFTASTRGGVGIESTTTASGGGGGSGSRSVGSNPRRVTTRTTTKTTTNRSGFGS